MSKIEVSKIEIVPVDQLHPFHKNPRRGDIDAIAESLKENGQYRPFVVNIGNKTGRSMEILAGNHGWRAAKKMKWNEVAVTYVDVDDEHAKKIVLADNRTPDLGTYDSNVLADLLQTVPEPLGTGYNDQDVKSILAAIESESTDDLVEAIRPPIDLVDGEPDWMEGLDEAAEFDKGAGPPTDEDDDTVFDGPEGEDEDVEFEDTLSELQGAFILNEDLQLSGDNYYGFPELKPSMLLDDFPEPLDTWAGKDATPDDGITHWLWNYGVAPFGGLPTDRATMCFYTHDDRFENWWENPGWMTAKLLNSGITSAVVPDYSLYSDAPVAQHVYNVWKAQWMGRFFQECGMKVVPRLQFANEQSLDFCLMGIPKNPPLLIHSAQNIESNGPKKPLTDIEKLAAKCISMALDRLNPTKFVIYGGPPSHRLFEQGHVTVPKGTDVVLLQNYVWKRRGVVFDKKEGLGGKGKERKVKKRKKTEAEATAKDAEDGDQPVKKRKRRKKAHVSAGQTA